MKLKNKRQRDETNGEKLHKGKKMQRKKEPEKLI